MMIHQGLTLPESRSVLNGLDQPVRTIHTDTVLAAVDALIDPLVITRPDPAMVAAAVRRNRSQRRLAALTIGDPHTPTISTVTYSSGGR